MAVIRSNAIADLDNEVQIKTAQFTNLIQGAPENLDTLVEVATLLNQHDLSINNLKITTDNKLSISGGIMTGPIIGLRETKVNLVNNNIDLNTGNLFTKTITTNTTFTINNPLGSPNSNSFILELTNAGSKIITWFNGVKWAAGTPPTLTSNGVDILGFYSHDGGLIWRGFILSLDSK